MTLNFNLPISLYTYIYIYIGGDRRVMVIVVGNGRSDPSSKPTRNCLHFTMVNNKAY